MRVLAVGATGQYGALVVPVLTPQDARVRALVHDPAKRVQAERSGADETVVGDLRDPTAMRAALNGVDGLGAMFADDTAHGFLRGNDFVLRSVLRRPPAPPQERFFTLVGQPVGTRTEAPPPLDEEAQAAFVATVQFAAPQYRTELLPPSAAGRPETGPA